MGRLSTCKQCGKKLTKEEKYTYSNKTYCIDCYNLKLQEHEDYLNLVSGICKYFNIDKPTGLILKQLKDYKNNFNYEYKNIMYCLWYITDVLHKKLDKKFGIALVKYEYENSMNYYNSQKKIEQSAKINKPKEVINKKIKIINNSVKHKLLINLDEVN